MDSFASASDARIETVQGFEVRYLRSRCLEIAAIPRLGCKISSLRNLHSGREWMWRPDKGHELFANRPGDDYASSTLIGWDECLPTVAPCQWRGRLLPDHGEAWSAAWEVDESAWHRGVLNAMVELKASGLRFERSLRLRENSVRVEYRLCNRTSEPKEFIWAMHPLISLKHGDRIELPVDARKQLAGENWLESLEFGKAGEQCRKTFAGPLNLSRAGISNVVTGDKLTFTWNAAVMPMLGLWLTRGGWHGHHHLALEPTNSARDSLAEAMASTNQFGRISANDELTWWVQIEINPPVELQ